MEKKIEVVSESVETQFEAVIENEDEAIVAEIAEQEAKWGEERNPTNE